MSELDEKKQMDEIEVHVDEIDWDNMSDEELEAICESDPLWHFANMSDEEAELCNPNHLNFRLR